MVTAAAENCYDFNVRNMKTVKIKGRIHGSESSFFELKNSANRKAKHFTSVHLIQKEKKNIFGNCRLDFFKIRILILA